MSNIEVKPKLDECLLNDDDWMMMLKVECMINDNVLALVKCF